VPLQVGVGYLVNGVELAALKTVWLGKSVQNPLLAEMVIDGESLDAKTELVVPMLTDVRFSVAAIPDDDVNWLTNVGEMHDFDLPESYLRVEPDEEKLEGELALVKRDLEGGDETGGRREPRDLPEGEPESEREHQEDDAQFGERVDGGFLMNQRIRRRVRADDDARNDVTQHHRLLETMKDNRDQSGHQHYDRQVLQKIGCMHS